MINRRNSMMPYEIRPPINELARLYLLVVWLMACSDRSSHNAPTFAQTVGWSPPPSVVITDSRSDGFSKDPTYSWWLSHAPGDLRSLTQSGFQPWVGSEASATLKQLAPEFIPEMNADSVKVLRKRAGRKDVIVVEASHTNSYIIVIVW
jgi:hypothetical protein